MADIDLTGSAFMTLSAEGDLDVRNATLQGNATMRMSGSGALTVKNTTLQGNAIMRMSGAGALTVKNSTLQGNATMRMSGSGTLNRGQRLSGSALLEMSAAAKLGIAIHLAGHADLVMSATGSLQRNRNAMGVCDIVREIYLVWGFEYPCKAPGWARDAALTVLNQSLQILWNRASDRTYWTQTTITVTVGSSGTAALSDDIQNVTGPARFDSTRKPLMALGSINEAEQFTDLFLDGDDSSGPQGYYIERERQTANDPVKCTLIVAPAPATDTDFLLDVVKEAPRYSWDDVTVCPRVPVPHRYVESLLLPVARYLSINYYIAAVDEGQRQKIMDDYAAVSGMLDEADPLPGKSGDNHDLRKEDKA